MLAAFCSSTLPSEPQILTFEFIMYACSIHRETMVDLPSRNLFGTVSPLQLVVRVYSQ